MKLFRVVPSFFLLLGTANIAIAADQNGYTAQYECRAGNPRCDVDVAALVARPCDQIITTGTPWSTINWSNNTICIAAGDHSAKGPLTLGSSGTASSRKVLRYYNASDNGVAPWAQSASQRATLERVVFDGADNWVVHRLTFDSRGYYGGVRFERNSASNNNVVDRVLVQNQNASLVHFEQGNSNNTLQNSVIRNSVVSGAESNCVELGASPGTRIVNNEIYDCNKAISAGSGNPTLLGVRIENNDLYVSPAIYSDCNGNYTPSNTNSPCAANEAIISLKAGGDYSDPTYIIHNRLWGARNGDGVLLGPVNTGEAPGISVSNDINSSGTPLYNGADYLLIRDNVIWDMQAGIANWWGVPDHVSIIGNLFYDIRTFQSSFTSYAIRLNQISNFEIYFNTLINTKAWFLFGYNVANSDIRCNVILDGGERNGGASGSSVVDNNAFYNTAPYTLNGSSALSYNDSASAQHTEFCFNRKLLTGAENVCIPNARPTTSSPHLRACKTDIGSRADVGISDAPVL